MVRNTHLCSCQAGSIASWGDRFAFPAARLPGHKLHDLVTFQEYAPEQYPAVGIRNLANLNQTPRMVPTGTEATFEIMKISPTAPDGSRVPFLIVERVQ